ncbi:uncharacterized protein Z520_08549 [Fonsecaea multimorphosa CBS 102226]|uniref:RBR-type E3 ubiquitin transferase n=1 Tax=Fonsecaea multimorphosa CBS 102226 TaxID=1442371 RepID=A0A0D2IFF5_9EURO|nr:uncharacterized protein Z520_08549 [Fonsecaea multimorphosa CBS 102226]KIX95841.1 hypothetical protein Z520_08549 [Fonsecaea multimorphosa CBS 102226]OAL21576.1 hypothetical protein AYO22_07972 [Fonsecaea multimorphosa]
MACSLVWRLLRHRPFTRIPPADPSNPPQAPASPPSNVLGSQPALASLNLQNHTDASASVLFPFSNEINDNLVLLNTMAGQGSPLIAFRMAVLPDHTIYSPFSDSEGYVGFHEVRRGVGPHGHIYYDWVYAFSTAAAASKALLDHPHISIGGIPYNFFPYEADLTEPHDDLAEPGRRRNALALTPPPPSDISPPRKRLRKSPPPPKKIVCKICFGDIDGAYSTPCRRCKEATCYECLKTQFKTAMQYIDRMPVMCCATVIHHEVARGILPEPEVEKYKQKYDEFNTIDPLYCPVPTCSAFIPPRMFKPTDKTVTCHACETAICTECRQNAKDEHVCATDDSRQFILQTFEYKTCPKCGTGVMKMFGCPHIRCQCGAHWCWNCQRPMNACYQKPCQAARGDGVHSEGGDQEPDSDEEEDGNEASASGPVPPEADSSTQMQAPQDQILVNSTTNTPNETQETGPNQAANVESVGVETIQDNENETQTHPQETAELTSDPNVVEASSIRLPENLDDPEEIDWEGVSMDFGDEPTDEAWDTWGCRHQFSEFGKDRIPEFWLVDMKPAGDGGLEVECMGCFNKVKVADGETKKTGFREKWCHQTPSRTTEPSTSEAGAAADRRSKRSGRKSHTSFECRLCGVVYCGACKKAARRRIASERVTPDEDPH